VLEVGSWDIDMYVLCIGGYGERSWNTGIYWWDKVTKLVHRYIVGGISHEAGTQAYACIKV
jgi:hypothetical protein